MRLRAEFRGKVCERGNFSNPRCDQFLIRSARAGRALETIKSLAHPRCLPGNVLAREQSAHGTLLQFVVTHALQGEGALDCIRVFR